MDTSFSFSFIICNKIFTWYTLRDQNLIHQSVVFLFLHFNFTWSNHFEVLRFSHTIRTFLIILLWIIGCSFIFFIWFTTGIINFFWDNLFYTLFVFTNTIWLRFSHTIRTFLIILLWIIGCSFIFFIWFTTGIINFFWVNLFYSLFVFLQFHLK